MRRLVWDFNKRVWNMLHFSRGAVAMMLLFQEKIHMFWHTGTLMKYATFSPRRSWNDASFGRKKNTYVPTSQQLHTGTFQSYLIERMQNVCYVCGSLIFHGMRSRSRPCACWDGCNEERTMKAYEMPYCLFAGEVYVVNTVRWPHACAPVCFESPFFQILLAALSR